MEASSLLTQMTRSPVWRICLHLSPILVQASSWGVVLCQIEPSSQFTQNTLSPWPPMAPQAPPILVHASGSPCHSQRELSSLLTQTTRDPVTRSLPHLSPILS